MNQKHSVRLPQLSSSHTDNANTLESFGKVRNKIHICGVYSLFSTACNADRWMDILPPFQVRYKSISSLLSKKEMERYHIKLDQLHLLVWLFTLQCDTVCLMPEVLQTSQQWQLWCSTERYYDLTGTAWNRCCTEQWSCLSLYSSLIVQRLVVDTAVAFWQAKHRVFHPRPPVTQH